MSASANHFSARRLLLGVAATVLFCVGATLVIAGDASAGSGLAAGVIVMSE